MLYLGDIVFMKNYGNDVEAPLDPYGSGMSKAVELFDEAERVNNKRLNGSDLLVLYYHRALALRKLGRHERALADMYNVARVNPAFAELPAYTNVLRDLRFKRAFQVLTTPHEEAVMENGEMVGRVGEYKMDAVQYLAENIRNDHDDRRHVLQLARLLQNDRVDLISVRWKIASVLKARMPGMNHGIDGLKWEQAIEAHYRLNP